MIAAPTQSPATPPGYGSGRRGGRGHGPSVPDEPVPAAARTLELNGYSTAELAIAQDDHGHLVSPEDGLPVAVTRR
jgi:hypothetical protein